MKKLKYYYLKYIYRYSRTFKLSLLYLYGRFVLFLALKGIKMPGLKKVKSQLPRTALDIFERKVLIYEIKGERFLIRKGPIWFRSILEKSIWLFDTNKFWFLILLKTTFAIGLFLIPIGLFLLTRGVLPVPTRVPYTPITTKLNSTSNLSTAWLYTEKPFQFIDLKNTYPIFNENNSRGVHVIPSVDPGVPSGLTHFGIGYYPSNLNVIQGFLTSENSKVTIPQQQSFDLTKHKNLKLRIQTYLFPSKNSNPSQCKIDFINENNNVIGSYTQITPDKNALSSGFSKAWKKNYIPNKMLNTSIINDFKIDIKTPPKSLTFHVTNLTPETDDTISTKNLSDDHCIFALGDFSIESEQITPLKRRGIIFILVDQLKESMAYNSAIMPNLNSYMKKNSIQFLEHRSQGNTTVPSVNSFMTSRYAREIGASAFAYAADDSIKKNYYKKSLPLLATEMQNLGYRVGGIGFLSLFTEGLEGGLDLGFHNAIISENTIYEARQITELMGNWLQNYGQSPFFLYLHYNTTHGPYKPPFEYINLHKLLKKPFGLYLKQQLYLSLGKYWDSEFLNILQKLKDLGIDDDVDIVITADHGTQIMNQPWYYLNGIKEGISGGYADKGHSLLDEEIHVPLIIHIAHNKLTNGLEITTPTAHVDLLPTLYGLAGGIHPDPRWRGFNLSESFFDKSKKIEKITQKRTSIYSDGFQYASILYWGGEFKNHPQKYIRQFEPDSVKLLLDHNPWVTKINWYQPEIFTTVNFNNHSENWVPSISDQDLRILRKNYFLQSPSHKILRIISKYSGIFEAKVTFKIPNANSNNTVSQEPTIDLLPDTIKVTKNYSNKTNTLSIYFKGILSKNDAIWINLQTSRFINIKFTTLNTPIMCQNGNEVKLSKIAEIFNDNVCPFFPPPDGIIDENYSNLEKPIVIQKSLSNEQAEVFETHGAGKILQDALREWGYAK